MAKLLDVRVVSREEIGCCPWQEVLDSMEKWQAVMAAVTLQGEEPVCWAGATFLGFETEIFGRQFTKLQLSDLRVQHYTERVGCVSAVAEALNEWQRMQGVFCAYIRFPEDRLDLAHGLEQAGYRFVENYLTFSLDSKEGVSEQQYPDIRPYIPSDIPVLEHIATESLLTSRFHSDPRIDPIGAAKTRAAWVGNSCQGRAEVVFVADQGKGPVGFVIGRRCGGPFGREAVLDLIAVSAHARGAGLGQKLTRRLLEYYSGRVDRITVGTQGKNGRAVRMYQRCGFVLDRAEVSFHMIFGK